jgi:DNA-directed RNA polymerase subunit RPC12/RpoP
MGFFIVFALIIAVGIVVLWVRAPYKCSRCGTVMKSHYDRVNDSEVFTCPKCGHKVEVTE